MVWRASRTRHYLFLQQGIMVKNIIKATSNSDIIKNLGVTKKMIGSFDSFNKMLPYDRRVIMLI